MVEERSRKLCILVSRFVFLSVQDEILYQVWAIVVVHMTGPAGFTSVNRAPECSLARPHDVLPALRTVQEAPGRAAVTVAAVPQPCGGAREGM